ncbi:hypothetical protein ACS0TY_023543 [Phlomoides rotata]
MRIFRVLIFYFLLFFDRLRGLLIFSKKGRSQEDAEEKFQLPLLPASDLKKFCKNWFRVIWCPNFVRLQSRIRVLIPRNSEMMIEYKHNSYYEETKEIRYPPVVRRCYSQILGSCDGLLCLLLRGRGHPIIAVYNPSTGKVQLCRRKYNFPHINCYWFGHHPSSGEYVLVLGTESHNLRYKVAVYNFTRRPNFFWPF